MTEAILVRAYSHHEKFLEEIFVLYAMGRTTMSGAKVGSYLAPQDSSHARDMIKSGMRFLEWNNPVEIVDRCDTYLAIGNPVKLAFTTNQSRLTNMRRVRNAIAHRSPEASQQFVAVVRNELRALPLTIPSPGELLMTTDPAVGNRHILLSYLDVLRSVATIAAG